MLERISDSAERLDLLIRDVLRYTRVLRDKAPLSPINLDALMSELQATYPDWTLSADLDITRPLPVVLGHKALLAQCFSNLVGNAIKFVARGVRPHIRVWAEPHNAQVRVYVQDNGIGIAAEHRDRVFALFERIHPASEYEGTGIGLVIARTAAERMGGKIDFESEPGRGSTFWLELKTGNAFGNRAVP